MTLDDDGQYYVDYLRGSQGEFDEEIDYLNFLARHRELIESGYIENASDERTLDKYRWLAKKHNDALQQWSAEALAHYGYSHPMLCVSLPEVPVTTNYSDARPLGVRQW